MIGIKSKIVGGLKVRNSPQNRVNTSQCPKPMQLNRRPMTYTKLKTGKSFTPNAMSDVSDISYYVGKSIILFTFFYTGLNYFHYKRLREKQENNSSNDKKPKQK
jgi:hypothetical protein